MRELNSDNAIDFLRAAGRIADGETAQVEELAGGVSNVVLRITRSDGDDFVLKQSRAKLRTAVDWRSRLERIWREADVMRELSPRLPAGVIPRVLFEDREHYLFAMEAVAADHIVWKHALLAGEADSRIAERAAVALAGIHAQTAGNDDLRERWGDQTVFDELRLDPYYRFVANRHPELRPAIEALIHETQANPLCVVWADFSPKNILVTGDGISLVDFETAHFGDPAFDIGFFLTHLLLKAVHHGRQGRPFLELAQLFWRSYIAALQPATASDELCESALSRRAVTHLAACLLARIDGKSPVEYLAEPQQRAVREFVLRLFDNLPQSVDELFARFETERTTAPGDSFARPPNSVG